MLNLLSILIGLVTLSLGLIAFTPFLGALNWIVLPIGIVGLAIGAMSRFRTGRNLNLVRGGGFARRLWRGACVI